MNCDELYAIFKSVDMDFFTGVPDSTFKDWMTYLKIHTKDELTNVIAVNECEAMAIATGYHLATNKIPVVYMQNSGFGKTINPLTSLLDPLVFSIPALLLIGWRGEPGRKDEPQHLKMGKILIPFLENLGITYNILAKDKKEGEEQIKHAFDHMKTCNEPYALLVRKQTIVQPLNDQTFNEHLQMTREKAIETIIGEISTNKDDVAIVSTTGKTSRELYELRQKRDETPTDFYMVGSMGCASGIALGIALNTPSKKKILALDGDGSILMQMGSLATIGHYQPSNFYHILFNNNAHDSTGGQPTVAKTVNFCEIAQQCGYNSIKSITTREQLKKIIKTLDKLETPCFIEVEVQKGARADLGRPDSTPIETKTRFMHHVQKNKEMSEEY